MTAALTVFAGCNSPETDFQKAEQANTEQAYETFLQRHPDSPLATKARSNLVKVSYENAKRTNTVAALESFLSRFPSSELSTNARTDLENLEFELAGRANTEVTWGGFLKKYTNSTHVAAGREGLGKCVFAQVSQENTAVAYEAFLTNHADCTLVPEAREKLASLLLAEALKTNTVGAYEVIVQRFSDTKAGGDARKGWAKLGYDACVKENTIAAYEQFLSRHGDSEWVQDVKARLEPQLEEQDWNHALLANSPSAYLGYYRKYPKSLRIETSQHTVQLLVKEGVVYAAAKEQPASICQFSLEEAEKIGLVEVTRLPTRKNPDGSMIMSFPAGGMFRGDPMTDPKTGDGCLVWRSAHGEKARFLFLKNQREASDLKEKQAKLLAIELNDK